MKNNIIKRIFYIIGLVFCLSFAGNALAAQSGLSLQDDHTKQEVADILKINSLDDIEKDLSKRFILGVFGKDALIFFLPYDTNEGIISQIKGLSEAEVQRISRPFNAQIVPATVLIMFVFFVVAICILMIYSAWVFFEGVMNTQHSGEFLKGWNGAFIGGKFLLGMSLIMPVLGTSYFSFKEDSMFKGSFSLAQYMTFAVAGISNESANKIWGAYINNHYQYYPIVKMPNLTAKTGDGAAMIDFALCAKSDSSSNGSYTINFNKSVENKSYVADFSAGRCQLTMNFGLDEDNIANFDEANSQLRDLGVSFDYEAIQKEKIKEVLQKTLNDASTIADNMIAGLKNAQEGSSTSALTPTNWQNYCSNYSGLSGTPSYFEIGRYEYYMASCLSRNMLYELTKVSDLPEDYAYTASNYINNNSLELCVHENNSDKASKALSVIDYDEKTSSLPMRKKKLAECVQKLCTNSASSPYQCASMLYLVRKINDREHIIRSGWMASGAFAYQLFSGYDNSGAKSIINKITANNVIGTKSLSARNNSTGNSTDTVSMNINLSNPDSSYDFESYTNYFNKKTKFADQYSGFSVSANTGNIMDILIFGKDGFLGFSKFSTCTSHPLKIKDGFYCRTITEEMHDFGLKLVGFAIEAKTLSALLSSMKPTKEKAGEVSSQKKGFLANYGVLLTATGTSAAVFSMFGGFTETSAFSDSSLEMWTQYPELVAFLVANMFDNSFVSDLISLFINLMFILGVIMGFILPMIPFGAWLIVISGTVIMLFEFSLMAPVWGASLLSPSNDHTSQVGSTGANILLTLLLRAPLLVTGLVVAWLLNNIIIGEILGSADISTALALDGVGGFSQVIGSLVIMIVYVILLYIYYNLIFSIIESLYETATQWIFSSGITPFNKQRGENWQSGLNNARSLIGK